MLQLTPLPLWFLGGSVAAAPSGKERTPVKDAAAV